MRKLTAVVEKCLIAIGIKYHAMSIHDNVDAKDDGAQIKRFVEAADVINDILKQVKSFFILNVNIVEVSSRYHFLITINFPMKFSFPLI